MSDAPLPPELRIPHHSRLAPDAPGYAGLLELHDAACARGDDGYLDPQRGVFVMTAQYHWSRGTCCDMACRHCPYVAR